MPTNARLGCRSERGIDALRNLVAAASLCALCGCGVTMHDGRVYGAGTSETKVQARYGKPDLVLAGFHGSFGIKPSTFHYYLDDRWTLIYRDGRGLWGSYQIQEERLPALRDQSRIYKELVPLARPGSSASEIIEQLGDPDFLDRVHVGRIRVHDYLPYRTHEKIPDGEVHLVFARHQLSVQLSDRVVVKAKPLTRDAQAEMLRTKERVEKHARFVAEDPPRVGMEADAVCDRWGRPEVVSALVQGHETLTPSWDSLDIAGDSPAERLGAEVTRWYFLDRELIVRLEHGFVMAIEPLPPDLKKRISDFLRRAEERRITKPLQERLR